MMDIRNARYTDADGVRIDCEIDHPVHGWIPFTADPNDPEVYGRTIHAEILGKDLEVSPYEPPATPEPSTDPADWPLYPAQFKAMVDYLGKDSAIKAVIANIPDPLNRSWALSRYLNSTRYLWTDAFLQQMREAIGMSVEDLSDAWMLAKELTSD